MANQQSKSRHSSGQRGSSARDRKDSSEDGRSTSQMPEEYRFARNLDGKESVAERDYRAYVADARKGHESHDDPDVLVDFPVVKVDSIELLVEDLEVQVSLHAKVLEVLEIDVGVEAYLEKLNVNVEGVEAQALLKARLDHVTAIIDRVMTTLDRNPELMERIGRALESVASGAEQTLSQTGEAVDEIGEGAQEAAEALGQGAGQAVGEVGGAAREVTRGLGRAGGGARTVAKKIGAAAKDEAKELGTAAARKVSDVGERRRRKRDGPPDTTTGALRATAAALRTANELGVKLDEIWGTGVGGRIRVDDVRRSARED
jgi:methyl-accepting chemotaxis protein